MKKFKIYDEEFIIDDDFEKYQYEEETDTYLFEGKEYDSDCEILETLLEQKIANHQP